MEKKRIAVLGPYPPPYEGIGIVAKTEFEREGTVFIGASAKRKGAPPGADLIVKGYFATDLPQLLMRFHKHRNQVDMVSAHFATTYGFVASIIKALYGKPYTVTCHGSDILVNLDKWPHRWLTKMALANADEIYAVSDAIKHRLAQAGFKATLKLNTIRPEFKPAKGVKKKKQIITVGTVYPRKGTDILIEAFGRIANKFPDYKLMVVGRATSLTFKKKLNLIMDHYGIKDRVEFIGEYADVPKLLNESELFVLPSRSEGYGLALAEAVKCCLPCIASDVGGVRQAVLGAAGRRRGGAAKCEFFAKENIEQLAKLMEKKLK